MRLILAMPLATQLGDAPRLADTGTPMLALIILGLVLVGGGLGLTVANSESNRRKR